MPLPSREVHNHLDGEECKEVLIRRFKARLDEIHFLRKFITLPRVKMRMQIMLEMYADQPTPEIQTIQDDFDILTDVPIGKTAPQVEQFEEVIDASPPHGQRPDEVREKHGLPVLAPVMQRDGTGKPLSIHDEPVIPGLSVGRQGNMTMATLDQGRAGLADPNMRDPRRDGEVKVGNVGRAAPEVGPNWNNVEEEIGQ